jgi:class 3 adenylate cyclase
VSSELKEFIRADENADLGHGKHVLEALTDEVWLQTVHPESQPKLFLEYAPYVLSSYANEGRDAADVVPEQFRPLLEQIEPKDIPAMWSSSFRYVDPKQGDAERWQVNMHAFPFHGQDGTRLGFLVAFFINIRPNLMALLSEGNEDMYQRMADLAEPQRRQAAILFCDLHGSTELSRQLSASAYFKLARELWTGVDQAVAQANGIIGKHSTDGTSAYFVVDDFGSPSEAARAAVATAQEIHAITREVLADTPHPDACMKVAIQWGGSIYIGQLVPGSRLEVTALGDEVNECALLLQCVEADETLTTKELLEQLDDEAAQRVGLAVERLVYQRLDELPGAASTSVGDLGGLAVTTI